MGYQFSIEYKSGRENSAADALSHRHEGSFLQLRASISTGRYEVLDELRKENVECTDLVHLCQQLIEGKLEDSGYWLRDELLLYKNRLKARD